jgi:hypothetical protein
MSDPQIYQSTGPRQILRIATSKGIYAVQGQPSDDPSYLAGWTSGFVITKAGKITTEQRLHPVPVNATGYVAAIDPEKIEVRAAAVGGIAQSNIRPYTGRMLYVVADVPPSAWKEQDIPAKSQPMTVVLKMATTTEEPDTSYFPPRGGVEWRLAHEMHPTYGPPWGNGAYLENDLDLQFYNGHMYFASYDRVGLHPDPNMKEEKVFDGTNWTWTGAAQAYRGGLWFDGQGGDASLPWGPATPTTKMKYGDYPQGGSIRLTNNANSKIYANTLGVFKDILFAAASENPGYQLVRFATPGEAHLSGIGWVHSNFMQVAKWEGWSIAKLIGTADALYIATDTGGLWGAYGNSPLDPDWQLVKISDHDVLGQRSVNILDETGELVYIDRQNRIWRGRPGKMQRLDETLQSERDVADLAGGITPPINQIEQFIYIGGMAQSTHRIWQREGAAGVEPRYEKEGPRPKIINKYAPAITLSRYIGFTTMPDHTSKGKIDAAFDPANARLYILGLMRRGLRTENNQQVARKHFAWYTDYALYPRNFVKHENDFRYYPEPYNGSGHKFTDIGAFVPWFFGTRHDLKRIHTIFVTIRPTGFAGLFGYVPPTPTVRFYCRYLTSTGWTAQAPDTTQDYSDVGWIPMALIDWTQDPNTWTPNYDVPADSRPHRIAIQRPDGEGDIGKGVYAFQLGWEFRGTDPPTGIVIDEVAVEYEIVRSWP